MILWVGSRYNLSTLEGCGPALRLDADTVEAKDHVRVLGVTFSADLTLDRHLQHQRSLFLSATPASPSPAATRFRVSGDTRPRPRDVAH